MYDLCHPSYYKISQLGSTDGTKITIAFYVYIELCEVKRLWDVEYKYNKELDIIYIEGKNSKSSVPETYIPWPAVSKISLAKIERIQQVLSIERFTFVFRGGDSTSVYYRVTAGLVKPIPPEDTKLIKQKDDKKQELEQEIRKNTSILYELAKSIDSNVSAIIENENEDTRSWPDFVKKLSDKVDEKKPQDTEDHAKIANIIDQKKNPVKMQTTKVSVQDTGEQEKQFAVQEKSIEAVDTDVEMISETNEEISAEIIEIDVLLNNK